jgi:hypothetical protein
MPATTASLAADGPTQRPSKAMYDTAALPTPREAAIRAEQRDGFATAAVGLVLQCLLGVLAMRAGSVHTAERTTWQLSLVVLALLLCGATMVSLLLAVEPIASRKLGRSDDQPDTVSSSWRKRLRETARRLREKEAREGFFLVWFFRGLTAAPVALALFLAWFARDSKLTWHECASVVLTVFLASTSMVAMTASRYWPLDEAASKPVGRDVTGAATPSVMPPDHTNVELDERLRISAPDTEWERSRDGLKVVSVGASGGGIRAASFVLGGHQALQTAAPAMGIAKPEDEPHVFAVSGGSYVAAALAMRRSFDGATGQPRDEPVPWTEAYTLSSVELERLRRHTRYLYEPRSRTLDGVLTLLTGAIINLFVAGAALLALTWVSAQIAMTLDLLQVRTNGSKVVDFWVVVDDHQVTVLLIPMTLAAGVAVLTMMGWFGGAKFDHEAGQTVRDTPDRGRKLAGRFVDWSGRWRAPLIAIASGWLLLSVGIPLASTGAAELATRNEPTATVARGLAAIGLATKDMCSDAFEHSLDEAVEELVVAASANPGSERSATAGACGAEYKLTWTAGGDATQPTIPAEDVAELEEFANLDDGKPVGRIGAIAALLLSVLGLLRRGPQPGEASSTPRGFAALRRRLLTVVPLGITAALAVYLMLLSFRWLVAGDADAIAITSLLVVVACGIAVLLDANGSSMHTFYRSRIADAFAIGVRDVNGRMFAQQLPPDAVYRFSDLPGPVVSQIEEFDELIHSAWTDRDRLRNARDEALAHGSDVVKMPDSLMTVHAVNQELTEEFELSREVMKVRQQVMGQRASEAARLHIVATLNSQKANESPAMRGGFPLVFGATEVQLFREGGLHVVQPMRSFENFAGPRRVSIMSSVAISGAAIGPLMGRYAEQMAPYRLLLALFNVRLGTWVRNPAHTPPLADLATNRHNGLWMTNRPGFAQLVLEGVGSSSASRRWVYLSDGGHLDNTGMVEAVRHCVLRGERARVLVIDASNDADKSWQAVGDAVAVIRADMCLDLKRHHKTAYAPWMRLYVASDVTGNSLVEVLVVKAVRVDKSEATVDAPTDQAGKGTDQAGNGTDWWAKLPPDVQSFQARHPDFPRASTGRQKFGDLEFEAYRALGFASVTEAIHILEWDQQVRSDCVT